MTSLTTYLVEGGPFLYPVLTGLVVLPLVAFWMFLTQLLRWRFPAFLGLGVALLVVIVGLLGTWYDAGRALEAIAAADASFVDQLAGQGYGMSLGTSVVAFALGAFGCAGFAAATGSGLLLRPGQKAEPTWGGLVGGLLFGAVTFVLAAWFAGLLGALVASLVAFGVVTSGARFPFETERDRARAASGRFVVGFHGFFAYLLLAATLYLRAEADWFYAYRATGELVAQLQALAVQGLDMAVGTSVILAVASMLMGLLQGSSRFEDLDGRAWAMGVLYLLTPLLVVVPLAMAGWNLYTLREQAVPWNELRAPRLQAAGIRPPRLDRELERITRAHTLQLTDAGVAYDDAPAPDPLEVGDTLNVEAGPDIALSRLQAVAPAVEGASLCLTVRAYDVLSCLPFRMATTAEAEEPRSLAARGGVPALQLVPEDRGWVLMSDEGVVGRGDLATLGAQLEPGVRPVRVWLPEGRTVEDLVATHKALAVGGVEPVLVWRTDPAPPLPEGDAAVSTDGIDREAVRSTIQRYGTQMRYCYERSLKRRPTLEGSVVVHFTIGPTGTVLEATTEDSTLADPDLETCLEARIRNLRFPVPKGGQAVVRYPFVFRPSP